MTGKGFTHLHLHSQYSLLDGAVTFDNLLKACKRLGMDSVAVTDHGNMFGAAEFYIKATAAGVKPIIGIEAYIAPAQHCRNQQDAGPSKDTPYLRSDSIRRMWTPPCEGRAVAGPIHVNCITASGWKRTLACPIR